jgi:YD repeat-containing protein
MVEKIAYLDIGHSLPSNAPLAHVPYVTRHTLYAGENQPPQVREYSYSDMNYLGFGSDRAWQAGEDTLFRAKMNYQYTSTETINGTDVVERTYNKYHLMEQAIYSRSGKVFKKEVYDYFANLSNEIEYQPAIYSLVRQEDITFYSQDGGAERTYSKAYEYDDYGNSLKVLEADGSSTSYSYYPAKGAEGCPANIQGFVSQLQEQRFSPASDDPDRMETFTYTQLPKLDNSQQYFILLKSSRTVHTRVEVSFNYYDDNQDRLRYGRRKSEVKSVGGQLNTLSFVYDFYPESIKTITTLSTHDDLSLTTIEITDLLFGNVIESEDDVGVVTQYGYDDLGRQVRITVSPSTLYEATSLIRYSVGDGNNVVTTIDAKENVNSEHFNNAGNPIRHVIAGQEIQHLRYDSHGQLIEQTDTPTINGRTLSLVTSYEYDVQGEICKVSHPDGRVENITQDPAMLTSVSEMVGLATEKTTFDMAGQPLHRETKDAEDSLLAESYYTYDGYGNLLSVEDTKGRITRFTYDKFDRETSSTRTVDGNDVAISWTYPAFIESDTPDSVSVDNDPIGTQVFDGLERKVAESSARGEVQWVFDSNTSKLLYTKSPRKYYLRPTFNDNLGVIAQFTIDNEDSHAAVFEYDNQSALLTSSLDANSKTKLIRDSLGRVVEERVELNDGEERRATYTYSLLGDLEEQTDFFGNRTIYQYDNLGRVETITQVLPSEVVTTTVGYDAYSRPCHYTTVSEGGTVELQQKFNSLGMELERSFSGPGYSQCIRQEFNDDLLIAKRTLSDDKGSETTESYIYDELGRLKTYRCSGTALPLDEYGNSIERQDFAYDRYGNILQVDSFFLDNTNNTMRQFFHSTLKDRVIKVTHTHSSYPQNIDFVYDDAGNMLNDDQGLSYEYNPFDQVCAVSGDSKVLSTYRYDAQGRVVSQTIDGEPTYLLYQQDKLRHEVCGGVYSTLGGEGGAILRSVTGGGESIHQTLLPDAQGSIVKEITRNSDGSMSNKGRRYTAYGEG